MSATNIEWADAVWNPVRGCTRVSEGCRNCYAEAMAARFTKPGMAFEKYAIGAKAGPRWTGEVDLITEKLKEPLHWRKPRRIFVNSMSDLFHEKLSFRDDIAPIVKVMRAAKQHTFLVLTKRPQRMLEFVQAWCGQFINTYREPLPNVWLGVSVEDQKTADERIPLLLETPAAVRFVSYEPALGPVNFKPHLFSFEVKDPGRCKSCGKGHGFTRCPNYGGVSPTNERAGCQKFIRAGGEGIDWIIVGGESGPHARPFEIRWAYSTIEQCKAAGVACFVKQLGAAPVEASLHVSDDPSPLVDRKGGDMSEWPEDLRVREFPR